MKKLKNWKSVKLKSHSSGHIILLDEVTLRTLSGNELIIGNRLIAHKVKKEWSKVKKEINYTDMPYTKTCFLTADRSERESLKLKDKLVGYGMSDLLCYRADKGSDLVKTQSKSWDPLVDWLQNQLDITLLISHSLAPIEQSRDLEKGLSKLLLPIEPLSLTAMNELVTLSNSLIIGLALLKGKISPEKAWKIMRIEEEWQRNIWGTLAEQKAEDKIKWSLFMHACGILKLDKRQ